MTAILPLSHANLCRGSLERALHTAAAVCLSHLQPRLQVTVRTAIGFIVMGFIGFFVKLIFIVSITGQL